MAKKKCVKQKVTSNIKKYIIKIDQIIKIKVLGELVQEDLQLVEHLVINYQN